MRTLTRHGLALLAFAVFAIVAVWILAPGRIPEGEWQTEDGRFWMKVDAGTASIGRHGDRSSFAVLPNRVRWGRLYDRDDLAKAHPQHLRDLGEGRIEWRREAVPPSPEYRAVFMRKDGERQDACQ